MNTLQKIKILLVDDHKMMRDGLSAVLEGEPAVDVIGEAEDGRSAVEMVRRFKPDVVVMDIGMPDMNGIEATRQITTQFPDVRVVGLSMYSDKRYVINMLDAGASGFVLKSAASDDLLRAVEAVAHGKKYLSSDITDVVVDDFKRRNATTRPSAYGTLGPRERQVLQLLAEGKKSRTIAGELGITTKTVEAHRRNIMRKLDRHSVAELTKYAVTEGLTFLEG